MQICCKAADMDRGLQGWHASCTDHQSSWCSGGVGDEWPEAQLLWCNTKVCQFGLIHLDSRHGASMCCSIMSPLQQHLAGVSDKIGHRHQQPDGSQEVPKLSVL